MPACEIGKYTGQILIKKVNIKCKIQTSIFSIAFCVFMLLSSNSINCGQTSLSLTKKKTLALFQIPFVFQSFIFQ